MFVVIREQLLDDCKLPSRDGLEKPMNSAELWRRVGGGHGCYWILYGERVVTVFLFYMPEANCCELQSELEATCCSFLRNPSNFSALSFSST